MGDEGTSTHVVVEHGKKLKMSSKSYNLQSQINLSRDRRRAKLLSRRLSGENQPKDFTSLDVVKSFAESISANFTVLTESMTNSFQKLGEN